MKLILILTLSLFSGISLADSYWVEKVSGEHVNNEDRGSITELLKMAFIAQGATLEENEQKAQFKIKSKVLKLGDSYILSSRKSNSKGQVLHSAQMKAHTLSDMDTVVSRVAASLIKEVALSQTADVTNITEEEELQNTRRYQATRQWIIGIGPGWSSGLRSSGGGVTFSLGYLWGLDPDFGVSLLYTGNSGKDDDDSNFSDFSFGMEYFFSRTKNSPVVGARLGYGSVTRNGCGGWLSDCEDGSDSGWNTAFSAGYKFFRTSSVNIGLIGSYFVSFNRYGSTNPSMGTVQFVVYY